MLSSEANPTSDAFGIVCVHGSLHGSWCWERLQPELRTPSVAIDLPGRGTRPRPLADVTIEECVQACIDDADSAGFDRIVLVGHSLGGVTISEVARRHRTRVAALVYVAAAVPDVGSSAAQTFHGGQLASHPVYPEIAARALFGNDLPDEVWTNFYPRLVPEAPAILNAIQGEYIDDLPRTYVYGLLDQALPPSRALKMAANLGTDVHLVALETGHSVMTARPAELARVIDDAAEFARCRP